MFRNENATPSGSSRKFTVPGSAMDMLRGQARSETPRVNAISLEWLIENPKNFFDMSEETIASLAEDIKQNGLIHMPVVEADGEGNFMILSGHRRIRAYRLLAKEDPEKYGFISCQIRPRSSEVTGELLMIAANLQTRELSPTERARAAARMMELVEMARKSGELQVTGRTRDYVGEQLGVSGKQAERLSSVEKKLLPELKALLEERKMTLESAFNITSKSPEEQRLIYEALLNLKSPSEAGFSVQEVAKVADEVARAKEEREAAILEREVVVAENEQLREERDATVRRLTEEIEKLRKIGSEPDAEEARLVEQLAEAKARQEAQEKEYRRQLDQLQKKLDTIGRMSREEAELRAKIGDVHSGLHRMEVSFSQAVSTSGAELLGYRDELAGIYEMLVRMAEEAREAMERAGKRE